MNPTTQPPAHHFDPDMADAILEAMLTNPENAMEIAKLSDDDLSRIAEETPTDENGDGQTGEDEQ